MRLTLLNWLIILQIYAAGTSYSSALVNWFGTDNSCFNSRRDTKLHNNQLLHSMGALCLSLLVAPSSSDTRFETAQDIPSIYFQEKRSIDAVVVKVTDGDTYRVRHIPHSNSKVEFDGKLTDHTIAIRIAAVDTPEISKFGNPGQKFGEEAKEFAQQRLLHKRVSIKLLSRDQYGRVVGLVRYKEPRLFFFSSSKDISEELLCEGLAVVYRQGGAQYDGSVSMWNSLEQRAIDGKKGIWSKGKANAELPSAYKKDIKKKQAQNRI